MGKKFSPSRERFRSLSKYFKDLPVELWNEFLNSICFVDSQGIDEIATITDGTYTGRMEGPIKAFEFEVRNESFSLEGTLTVEGKRIVLTLKNREWG